MNTDKITLKLTSKDWLQLTALVLAGSASAQKSDDKYMRAILHPTLRQVYIKLHNRMHSLKAAKNSLNLTLPEAATLSLALQERDSLDVLIVGIVNEIDQKLT